MNCPNCGAESTYGLNYCKQCGSNLLIQPVAPDQRLNPAKLSGMFWAIALFGLGGLAVLLGTLLPIVLIGSHRDIVIPIVFFGASTIFGIAALLIRQLSRLITMMQDSQGAPQKSPGKLRVPETPQLSAPRAISSVTEHTTRNFEPANYRDPEVR